MVHFNPSEESKAVNMVRLEKPPTLQWQGKEYLQFYDLPKDRGGILVEVIPCPICRGFEPFEEHDARVEKHRVGGDGYIKHICCDKSGTYWREI